MMKKWLVCLLLLALYAVPCAGADDTRDFTGTDPNSAQYDTHTLYMDIDRNVVGCWAAIGAQDSMPYLIIREDGTMEEIGYDGESGSVQGEYTYDPQTGLFTFPDGQLHRR